MRWSTLRDLVIAGAVTVLAANTATATSAVGPPGQIVTPGPLSVTTPSTIAVNAAFSVQVTLEDASGNPITTGAGSTDRVYITVNRLGSQTLLLSGGRVTFNNLKATSTPVTIVVTDPTRNLSRTVSVPGGPPASAPRITTSNAATITIGTAGSFEIDASGPPAPAITISAPPGSPFLPSGVTFQGGNGTATLTWTSSAGPPGIYNLTIMAANGTAPNAVQSFTLTVRVSNIVVNGGFETGDFTGWTSSGSFQSVNSNLVHTGNYAYSAGSVGGPGSLLQTLTTVPGASYTLTFWLASDGGTPNSFQVNWDGSAISSLTMGDAPFFGYTLFTATVTASSASTTLEFLIRDDPGYYNLDDVSVTQN